MKDNLLWLHHTLPEPVGWIKDSERLINEKIMNLFKKANNIGNNKV